MMQQREPEGSRGPSWDVPAAPRDLPKTWLVVPCYNEGSRLNGPAFLDFLGKHPAVRLCFVNDGSRDNTEEVLQSLAQSTPGRVVALRLERNSGKAEAVRRGVLHVLSLEPSAYVGYWDADLATPLHELLRFFAVAAEYPEAQMLLGCRLKRLGATVTRHWQRHLLGRVYATLVSNILRLPVYDTQCGAKLLRSDLAAAVFAAPFLSRWCFDVELLAQVALREGVQQASSRIIEVPLREWQDVGGSKVRPRDMVAVALDLWRIFRRYHRALGESLGRASKI